MRLLEILTPPTKFPLFELAMNQRTYQQIASQYGDKINVGFEFEFTVSKYSQLYQSAVGEQPEPEKKMIHDLDLDDINHYFELLGASRRGRIRDVEDYIEDMYNDFVQDKAKDYADKYWQDFGEEDEEDEDDNEEDKKEQAFEYYVDEEAPSREEFFDKEVDIDDIPMEPVYGYTDHEKDEIYIEEFDAHQSDEIIDSLIGAVEGELDDEHIDYDEVTTDGSVTWPGIEVVTNPHPIKDAIENLSEMIDWMHDNDVEVDNTAGLHINISVDNIDQLDPVKLAVFLGDEYSLKVFNRLDNMYSPSQINRLVQYVKRNGTANVGNTFEQIVQSLKEMLNKNKYGSFNLQKLNNGYIEFRIAGGANYHRTYKIVEQMVYRFATSMVVAADPNAYRQEYIKKISKLLQRGEQQATRPQAAGLPRGIIELDKESASDIADNFAQYQKHAHQKSGQAGYHLVEMLLAINGQLKQSSKRLGIKDIQFLRKLYQQHKDQVEQRIQHIQGNNPQTVNDIYSLLRMNTQKKQMTP